MRYLNYKELQSLDAGSRQKYLQGVEEVFGGEYRLRSSGTKSGKLPSLEHAQSKIEFNLIPGGEFTMGLTNKEEGAARAILDEPPLNLSEMRPAKKRVVGSFLISTTPLLVGTARKLFGDSQLSPHLAMVEPNPHAPVYVQREAALFMAESLHCRLPYEAEWEYACRANTKTLFVWGNDVPSEEELEKWLDFGLRPDKWEANRFGLSLLFSGDWCMDNWTTSHEEGAEVTKGAFVIKGGGSIFWPWQDQEWVWCMPSMRMPSTDLSADGCAFRLVRELPEANS